MKTHQNLENSKHYKFVRDKINDHKTKILQKEYLLNKLFLKSNANQNY